MRLTATDIENIDTITIDNTDMIDIFLIDANYENSVLILLRNFA
jgi:hypothetical protein